MAVIDDDENEIVSSEYLRLELLPKPTAYKNDAELGFLAAVFDGALEVQSTDAVRSHAMELACRHGLGALDALLIASAIAGGAEEFVTAEKRDKPMFKVTEIRIRSIHADEAEQQPT